MAIIESLIQREGGTVVELEGTRYHFLPLPRDPRHLAEVLIEAHAQRFLAVTEGFQLVEGEVSPAKTRNTARSGKPLHTSGAHAAVFTLENGTQITLTELTEYAFRQSGLSEPEWNALDDEDLHEWLDSMLVEMAEAAKERSIFDPAPAATTASTIAASTAPVSENDNDDDDADELEAQRLAEIEEAKNNLAAEQQAQEAADKEAERLRLEKEGQDSDSNNEQGDDSTNKQDGDSTGDETPPPDTPPADEQKETKGDDAKETKADAAEESPEQLRERLVQAYTEKMGRKPHHKLTNERILAVLAEADEE